MDRWRSGTQETCHSSHHHAACTPSASLSLQVFFSPLLPHTAFSSLSLHSSLHLFSCFQTLHSLRDFAIISLFPSTPDDLPRVPPLLALALILRFHHLLWQHSSIFPIFYPFFLAPLPIFSPFSSENKSPPPKKPSYFTIDILEGENGGTMRER